MLVSEVTVEVRDKNLNRMGTILPQHISLKATLRWCSVGEWELTLPGAHPMVPHLRTPGSGISVLGPQGVVEHEPTYSDWEPITWDQDVAPERSITRSGVPAAQGYVSGTEVDVQPGQVIRASVDWNSTDPADSALFGLGAYKNGVWEVAGSGGSAWGDAMSRWIGPVYSTDRTRRVKHFVVPDGVTKVMFSHYKNGGTGLYTYTMGLFVVPVEDPDIRVTYAGTPPALGAPSNVESSLERRTLIRGPWRETVLGTLFSGPTTLPKRIRTIENPDGTLTFKGVTDDVLLEDSQAFPQPTNADPTTQTSANDTRTGKAETLMRQYVAYNTCYTHAPAGRIRGFRQYLTLKGSDGARGATLTKSPRFQNLLELLQEIATGSGVDSPLFPGLGFRVAQDDDQLLFECIPVRDLRDTIRLDINNGTVTSEEVQEQGPTVTDAIVAGQGDGTARTIVRRQDTSSETTWMRPIERFYDRRDTDATVELQQKGDEELSLGAGGTSAKLVPADDQTMRIGLDFWVGDWVTAVVDGVEKWSVVSEAVILLDSSRVAVGVGIGDVSNFSPEGQSQSAQNKLDSRIGYLERAVSGPVSDGQLPARIGASAMVLTSQDLDTVIDSGWYVQVSNVNSTLARHYPVATAGFLEVIRQGAVGVTVVGILQRYTLYNSARVFQRLKYAANTFGAWVEVTAPDWGVITGKPTAFTPATHSHPISQISDLSAGLRSAGTTPAAPGNDFNLAIDTGFYYGSGSTLNTPDSSAWWNLTVENSGSRSTQYARRIEVVGPVYKRWRLTPATPVTWSPWIIVSDETTLPLPWVGNGDSTMSITSTGWAAVPGTTRLEMPAYTRNLLVDVAFGAEGSASAGYFMVGASTFNQTGSPAWSISPENADPALSPFTNVYGIYAPFASTTQQSHIFGSKSVIIPKGTASVFQMAMRKSTASATATLNYASIEVKPQRWL